MKAITIWQPWASLIAWQEKRYETRSWETKYRGPLAIHAGLDDSALDVVDANSFYRAAFKRHGDPALTKLPLGEVVCVVDLVDVVPVAYLCALSQSETTFGDYSPSRFAWRLDNLRVLVEPIPVRGKQGLWEWPVELESLVFVEVKQ